MPHSSLKLMLGVGAGCGVRFTCAHQLALHAVTNARLLSLSHLLRRRLGLGMGMASGWAASSRGRGWHQRAEASSTGIEPAAGRHSTTVLQRHIQERPTCVMYDKE